MEWVIAVLCLWALFGPSLIGIGITLMAERQIGRWAYALGWLLPVIVLATCYGGYDALLRLISCEPAQSLACGEPIASAFLLLVGMICITMIANALAQGAVFMFLRARRERLAAERERMIEEGMMPEEMMTEYEPMAGDDLTAEPL